MEMTTTKLLFFAKLSKWKSQKRINPGGATRENKHAGKGQRQRQGQEHCRHRSLDRQDLVRKREHAKKQRKSNNNFKKKNKEKKSSSSEMEEVKTPSPSPVRDNQGKQQGTSKPYWNPRWSLNRWHTSAKMWNGWQTKSWRPRAPFWPRGSKGDSGVGWKGKGHGGKGRNVH